MLSRRHRFHGLGSLNFAYRQGRTVRGPSLGMKFALNPRRNTYRVAVVVSRKISKSAVVRNRARRRVYQAFQAYAGGINKPYDLVFTVFTAETAEGEYTKLTREIESLLRKADVLMDASEGHDIVSTEGK